MILTIIWARKHCLTTYNYSAKWQGLKFSMKMFVFAEIDALGAWFFEAIKKHSKTDQNPSVLCTPPPLWKITHQNPSVLCTPPLWEITVFDVRLCRSERLYRGRCLFRQIRYSYLWLYLFPNAMYSSVRNVIKDHAIKVTLVPSKYFI